MRASYIVALMIALAVGLLVATYLRRDSPAPESEFARGASDAVATAPSQQAQKPTSKQERSPPEVFPGVGADNQRSPIAGPHGRVIESETDRPIEGLVVAMRAGLRIVAETVTGSDGAFALPRPDQSRSRVLIVSDEWRITPSTCTLDEQQSSGAAELLFHAERIVAAPLKALLVDAKTGEPVPEFLVQARGPRDEAPNLEETGQPDGGRIRVTFKVQSPPRDVENIVTDSEGRLASKGKFESGLLALVLVDHPSFVEQEGSLPDDQKSVEHQHSFDDASAPNDVEIKIAVGPTYRFDMTLPDETGVEDFYATFPQPSAGLREMHRAVAGDPGSPISLFYGNAVKPNALEQQAPIRNGELFWARFREPVVEMPRASADSGKHVLHVRSRDGYWSGSADVSSIEGIYPQAVSISLDARGAVEGAVLDGGGKPVRSSWIQLVALAAPDRPIREVGADPEGRFAFRWIAEGEYEVVVQTDRYEEARSTISIVNGKTERAEIRLTSGVPLGTVSGVVRSRTGQYRSKGGLVSLRSLADPGFFLFKSLSYRKRQGEYSAAFSFENVPSGSYELRLKPLDNRRWETLTMTVSPPAEGLEFICEDDAPTFDLELRAIDAQSGSPIEESWNVVWQGDPQNDVRLDDDWQTGLYKGVSEGVRLQWVIRSEGYRLATGDETSLRTEPDRRVIEARLDRGWGQIFKITTRDDAPIEGVELLANDAPIGTTDSRGMVSMNLDAKPKELAFRYKDWVVTWGRVDPNEEGFGWGPETPVHMGPGQ